MSRPISSRRLVISLVATILLLVALLLVLGQAHAESETNTITLEGNTDAVVFTINFTPANPIRIVWGVSNQPLHEQFLTFTSSCLTVTPPSGTVSILVNISSVSVQTMFPQLTSDGWYSVPQADHRIVITGDTHSITFTTNYTPTSSYRLVWGISGQPLQEQFITLTNRSLTVTPPANAVSLLINNSGVAVQTNFQQLTSDGWYQIPIAQFPPPIHILLLPVISRR